jgi:Family of unknown function (DUF5677)
MSVLPTNLYPSPRRMRRANRELVALVRSNYPMRFYAGERWWKLYAAAALLRMCDTVESIMGLLPERRDLDAQTLLRSLYEQVVTFAWVMIEPTEHHRRWEGEAKMQLLVLHNDALRFGERVLSDREVAASEKAEGLPSVAQRAQDVDAHWPQQTTGFHAAGHLLSFRGLYVSIYRIGSRSSHGNLQALTDYIDLEQDPRVVAEHAPIERSMVWYALAGPLLGLALITASPSFPLLDEVRVRRLVERATTPA